MQAVAVKAAGDIAVLQVDGRGLPLTILDQAIRPASWLFGAIGKKIQDASSTWWRRLWRLAERS